jgi:acetyltransferase
VDRARAAKIIHGAGKQKTIVGGDALDLLAAYGIAVARSLHADSAATAAREAARLGFPVIMKIDDPDVVHKTDVGGVSGKLRSEAEVAEAFAAMEARFKKSRKGFAGVIVQELVPEGVETILGMNLDLAFGPLMMFGLGGVYVEVMKDVSFRIHPVTAYDVKEMIKSIRGYPLLTGFRGAQAVCLSCLEESLLRLSQLVSDFPQLESLDVNPFIVTADEKTSKAVDARFMLSA